MKKEKTPKVKPSDFPSKQAVYPIRCGTEVIAIDWDNQAFVKGTVVSAFAITELDEPGAEYYYIIEHGILGEETEPINGEFVYLTEERLFADIKIALLIDKF